MRAAAPEVSDPASIAVARAAGHGAAVAHMAAHARGAPAYAAKAGGLAARCLYIKDLKSVNLGVLETIIGRSYVTLRADTYTLRAREGG